jgi:hypothetical protein
LEDKSGIQRSDLIPSGGIFLVVLLLGVMNAYFSGWIFYGLKLLLHREMGAYLPLFLFAVPVVGLFVLPITNWIKMGRIRKAIIHAVYCVVLLLLLGWLSDQQGIFAITTKWRKVYFWAITSILTLAPIYMLIINWLDIRAYNSAGKETVVISSWTWFRYTAIILAGWVLISSGLNLGARLAGQCKFPVLYEVFGKREIPSQGLEAGLISPYDFHCGWTANHFVTGNDDPVELSKAQALPLHNAYYRGLEEYDPSSNSIQGSYIFEQYIWFDESGITDDKINVILEFEDIRPSQAIPTQGVLDQFHGPRLQYAKCNHDALMRCSITFVYRQTVTKLYFYTLYDPSSDAVNEILIPELSKINERMLTLDTVIR